MSYSTELANISNQPMDLVVLTLDYCARSYGIASCAAGVNLVTNGTMEADANWASYGTPATNEQIASPKHGGSYSRHFVPNGRNEGIRSDVFTTTTGTTYRASLWIYSPVASIDIRIGIGDGSGFATNVTRTHTVTIDTWAEVTFDYEEAAGGASAYIVIESGMETSGDFYVDDVRITDLSVACYNTYFTCKDRANYSKTTKDYDFTSIAAVPFGTGERPYIKNIKALATEIKDSETVIGRETVTSLDEPDGDIGIDP